MVVREYVVWRFQFLQTNHVGLSILQPMVDVVDAGAQPINIPSRQSHKFDSALVERDDNRGGG
jgi:hypothetical protein